MPTLTRIVENRRTPTRRTVWLDGRPAFTCGLNVVARFRLRVGMELSAEQVQSILRGEVRQECLDAALRFIGRRLHSRAELSRKLARAKYPPELVEEVLDEVQRLGYVDDGRFARTRALSAARHKHHGRRRVMAELTRSGVGREAAEQALDEVYSEVDASAIARQLAEKAAPRLKKLDPQTARRRLAGMLARRGFEYEEVKAVIDAVLGDHGES